MKERAEKKEVGLGEKGRGKEKGSEIKRGRREWVWKGKGGRRKGQSRDWAQVTTNRLVWARDEGMMGRERAEGKG